MEKSKIADDGVKDMQESCCLPSTQCTSLKHSKRNYKNNGAHEVTLKKPRTLESGMNSLNYESTDDTIKLNTKKRRSRSRENNSLLDPAEIKNVLEGMDEEIDDILEETAQNKQLTATNVKNILRHVITNKYVLTMVRNTMKTDSNECDDLEEAVFEPKLTRSKVKELREKKHMLPWPILSPMKQNEPAPRTLLEEEFSDGSSSDEDYKPNEDECHSEDDILPLSPKSADLNSSICEKTLSPIKKISEEDADEDALVIELPESEHDPETAAGNTEADKIALRTRSKLPLNDTPLEAIEASFIAPDFTVDMYDTHCDDEEWQEFLRELSKPIDAIVAVDNPGEEPDDVKDDPEYDFFAEDDVPDELDLRFDRITKKELNALLELSDEEDEDFDMFNRPETPICIKNNDKCIENTRTEWMIFDEKLQLDQQMRMYVQLLSQSYLLSAGNPDLNYINKSSKLFLEEIKMYASRGSSVNARSAFDAHNLDGALSIVNEYGSGMINVKQNTKSYRITSPNIKKTLFNSNVFIYPELLPVCSYYRAESKKAVFTAAENNLIALGLEEFSFSSDPVYYINSLLVPTRTEQQLRIHIKNSKSKQAPLDNPIKYYFKYKHTPVFPRLVREFNPNDVKAPKDYHPDYLPTWMRIMYDPASISTSIRILPLVSKKFIPSSPVHKIDLTPTLPETKSYRKILPKNKMPVERISAISEKHSQKIHSVTNDNNTLKTRKSVQFAKRLVANFNTVKYDNGSEDTNEGNAPDNVLLTKDINVVSSLKSNSTETLTSEALNISQAQASANSSNTELNVTCQIKISKCISDVEASQCDDPVETKVVGCEDEENTNDELQCTAPQKLTDTSCVSNKKPRLICIKKSKQKKDLESSLTLLQHNVTVTSCTSNKKLQFISKKKKKQKLDFESSLTLLKHKMLKNSPKKEEDESFFANSYLLRVTEALKTDLDTYNKFLKTLCGYQRCAKSPSKLYFEIKEILKNYPALVEDFVAFLCPEQAKDCGKYIEYVTLCKIRQLISKIEVHFRNQPQHLLKIVKAFSLFKQQSAITSAEVLTTLQPLLKNESHLMQELASIFPDIAPPE